MHLLLLGCAWIAACSDPDTSVDCLNTDLGVCSKFTNFSDSVDISVSCPVGFAQVSDCPTEGVVAECAYGSEAASQLLNNFYYEGLEPEDLIFFQSDCRSFAGTWSGESLACAEGAKDPANCCVFANDGLCDEPEFCAEGTDTTDCRGGCENMPGPDCCVFAFDGECDEAAGDGFCPQGTDTTDCTKGCDVSPGPNCCVYANDGLCDEPEDCAAGTDTADCSDDPNDICALDSDTCCAFADDGECDEPGGTGLCAVGTDPGDCGEGSTRAGLCLDTCIPPEGVECPMELTCIPSLTDDGICVVDNGGLVEPPTGAAACDPTSAESSCDAGQACIAAP
ncbi:MAG: hypothetical protein AAFS10_14920 [Myxococcota bacterium]